MSKYESVIIINPNVDEKGRKQLVDKIENLISQNGKLTKTDDLGKKRLAYEVKKCNFGYYIVFYFESELGFIKELERVYRITDEVIKFLNIRTDD